MSKIRNGFRRVHLWLSVPFGLFITLICFSGSMLVFEDEVNEILLSDLYRVDGSDGDAMSLSELMPRVAACLPDSVDVTGVTIFPDPSKAYKVSLSKPNRASLWVDQYTGEIKGMDQRLPFFKFMFSLHRWILDSERPADGGIWWGKLLTGISTLLLVIILFTGVVIWMPKKRRELKNRLRIPVSKGWYRFWLRLHDTGGVYAVVLLLVLSFTGMTWSFQWYNKAFYAVLGSEAPIRGQRSGSAHSKDAKGAKTKSDAKREDVDRGNLYEGWHTAYKQVYESNPDKQIAVSSGLVSVALSGFGNKRASDKFYFDKDNGKIVAVDRYSEAPRSSKIRGWIYSLHVGSWGGMTSRILTFIVALFGATLPLTGYYLWIKRLLKKGIKND